MKKRLSHFLLFSLVFLASMSCQQKTEITASETTDNMRLGYDSLLAQKYGADAYGMKKYVMAFLKRGPNRDLDSAKAMELQMAHLQNIERMAEEGKLVLAGPFLGDGDLRGIYIFDVHSIEEAQALTESDPAIQAGSLVMELKEWYGSAAIMQINETHYLLQKKNITDE